MKFLSYFFVCTSVFYFSEVGCAAESAQEYAQEAQELQNMCSICFENFEVKTEGERIAFEHQDEAQRVSHTKHYFHEYCLDRWFDSNDDWQEKNCPLCRVPVSQERGDLLAAIEFCRKDCDVLIENTDIDGLHRYVESQDEDGIQIFLKAINRKNKHGCTYLDCAVRRKDLELVRFLLPFCTVFAINTANQSGNFVIHEALVRYDRLVARELVSYCLPEILNRADNAGFVPWYYAIESQDLSMIRLLKEAGALCISIGASDPMRKLITRFLRYRNGTRAERAWVHQEFDIKTVQDEQAFLYVAADWSIRWKQHYSLQKLIRQAARINYVLTHKADETGATLLLVAAQENNLEGAKILIKSGAKRVVYRENNQGESAYSVSARQDNQEMRSLLVHKNIVEKIVNGFCDAHEQEV